MPNISAECAVEVLEAPTATDNCAGTIVGTTNDPLSYTQQGNYSITWTFDDGNGNVETQTQSVLINDQSKPEVLTKNITLQLDSNGNASISENDVDKGTNDPCGIASLEVYPNTFDCMDQGENTVTLTATDNNGNVSTGLATVTVEDNIAPSITTELTFIECNTRINASIYEVFGSATDNCELKEESYIIPLPIESISSVKFSRGPLGLSFNFQQGQLTLLTPKTGAAIEAWWQQIQADGGIKVAVGNKIYLSDKEDDGNINFYLGAFGDIRCETHSSLTLVHKATDQKGNQNSESITVNQQCSGQGTSFPSIPKLNRASPQNEERSEISRMDVFPNPFIDQVNIEFYSAQEGQLSIDVFNLQGQRVRNLFQGQVSSGEHMTQQWDGRNRSGAQLPSGMYLIRLQTGDEVVNKKVLLQHD